MTIERYNTPNHPRWHPTTETPSTELTDSRTRYGQRPPRREGCQTEEIAQAGPSLLQQRDGTEDTTLELHDTSEWVCIRTELPDRSLEAVHVSVSGASVRIQAESSDTESGMDRTITLSQRVNAADMVLAYDDPVLTVIVPHENY
jgi:HSP20 family molecular chaperone IbpA